MRLLVIGDVVGRPGRRAVREWLPGLKADHGIDLVIANGENVAGGNGITRETAQELFACGVDVLTMGNHVWDKREVLGFIDREPRIVRPANYPPGTPGLPFGIYPTVRGPKVAIGNLSGRVFMPALDCPFRRADEIVDEMRRITKLVVIDFHAEATSEKVALGWHLDGRVTAVLGTHTHVQTADERILPGGTAYITDLGMTGPRDSVIGVKREIVIEKFVRQLPQKFETATGPRQFNAVVITAEDESGKALGITRINLWEEY
ncbi:MAG: TIGR00282 family metallophosphoesterase [Thermoanaerobacterales bacterium]|nr:TIGR00282 family metallophosphoesterase [Bacillota bacterium]MDI6907163.1 TIGR00282 family metallophosphoesterase [Thermoanaerobacterales bacterium]